MFAYRPARLRSALVLAAAAAMALPAAGQDEGLDWEEWPEEYQEVISPAAKAADRDGKAVVTCAVGPDRWLRDCKVVEESPTGFGFGASALKLAAKYRLSRKSAAGRTSVTRNFDFVPNLVRPNWAKKPTAQELAAVFPIEAVKRRVDGRATIKCMVTVQGSLRACRPVFEDPPGLGFGMAALALAPQFRMTPATRSGRLVEADVTIPIKWEGVAGGSFTKREDHIVTPVFQSAPTRAQMLLVYPAKARSVEGRVVMDCRVLAEGALGRCKVVAEKPSGRGFGRAAESLAPHFRLVARYADGRSVEGALARIPVTFSPELSKPDRSLRAEWQRLPDAETASRLYPAAAREKGVEEGEVQLKCRIGINGVVEQCKAASETPAGLGFGAAAAALAAGFQMRPWSADGQPVDDAPVRIPVKFRKPETAAAPLPAEGG